LLAYFYYVGKEALRMLILVFLFLLGIIAVLVLYLVYAVSRLGRKLDDT
jgi:uncharacterized protein YybS (DUF2232 family)